MLRKPVGGRAKGLVDFRRATHHRHRRVINFRLVVMTTREPLDLLSLKFAIGRLPQSASRDSRSRVTYHMGVFITRHIAGRLSGNKVYSL